MSSNLKIKRICAWCGKEFIAQKTTTACCSKQCANALYKKRKRDEAIKTNYQIVRKKIEEKPIERIKDKPFLTITEAALYLGVTRPTVYSYIRRDELKVIRLGFKYLLKKEDIDKLFNTPTEFHTPTKEKAPITDFYTTVEVKEKYHINESWIFAIAQKHGIPRTFNRGKTYWSKKHIDAYFAKKAPDPDITEWYSTQEMQEKFGMTHSQEERGYYGVLLKKTRGHCQRDSQAGRNHVLYCSRSDGEIQPYTRPAIPLREMASHIQDKEGQIHLHQPS